MSDISETTIEQPETKSTIEMVVAVVLAILLVGAVIVPIITTSTTHTHTDTIENHGAGWLKLDYNEGNNFNFEITTNDDTITVGLQSGPMGDNIFYADGKNVILADGDLSGLYLIDTQTNNIHRFSDTVSVRNSGGTLDIADGSETVVSISSPAWAYLPAANGGYRFFNDGNLTLEDGMPTVAVGSMGGIFAYNDDIVAPGNVEVELYMHGNYSEGDVTWETTPEPLGSMNSAAPSSLNGGGSSQVPVLGAADPTTGTQIGDLYYTFSGTNASIVGYSSAADWSNIHTVPSTVENNGTTYNVTRINYDAFKDCTSLVTLTLPNTITYLGNNAFQGCTNLTHIDMNGVTSIQSNCFYNCSSLEISTVPASVTTIGSGAFASCTSITNFTIPSTVTSLQTSNLFQGCTSLQSVEIYATSSIGGFASCFKNCTNLTEVVLPTYTQLGGYAFMNCTSLEHIDLPEGITRIGSNAFKGCTNLVMTSLPDTITHIESYAFSNCPNVVFTSLPESVMGIFSYAFENSGIKLSELNIGAGATVDNYAFSNCPGIDSMVIYGTPKLASRIFAGCSLTELAIVGNPTILYDDVFMESEITTILNLGTTDVTASANRIDATVQDYIPALGYIAPLSISETTTSPDGSITSSLMKIIPVMVILAVIVLIGSLIMIPKSGLGQNIDE